MGEFHLCSNRPAVDYYHINYTQSQNEQAIEELQFPIGLPTYLPEQLTMRGGLIHIFDGKHRSFETRYLDSDNTGGFRLYAAPGSTEDIDLARMEGFGWGEVAITMRVASSVGVRLTFTGKPKSSGKLIQQYTGFSATS